MNRKLFMLVKLPWWSWWIMRACVVWKRLGLPLEPKTVSRLATLIIRCAKAR